MIQVPPSRGNDRPPEHPQHRFADVSYPEHMAGADSLTPEQALAAESEGESELAAWTNRAAGFVGDHPKICLAAALAVGITVGWLLKRR